MKKKIKGGQIKRIILKGVKISREELENVFLAGHLQPPASATIYIYIFPVFWIKNILRNKFLAKKNHNLNFQSPLSLKLVQQGMHYLFFLKIRGRTNFKKKGKKKVNSGTWSYAERPHDFSLVFFPSNSFFRLFYWMFFFSNFFLHNFIKFLWCYLIEYDLIFTYKYNFKYFFILKGIFYVQPCLKYFFFNFIQSFFYKFFFCFIK